MKLHMESYRLWEQRMWRGALLVAAVLLVMNYFAVYRRSFPGLLALVLNGAAVVAGPMWGVYCRRRASESLEGGK